MPRQATQTGGNPLPRAAASYARVAVPLPVTSTFDYRLPPSLKGRAAVGKRVWVPFRNVRRLGVIVELVPQPQVNRVKPIAEVLDDQEVLSPDLIDLTRWMAEVYQTGWGESIFAALPGALRRGKTSMVPREELFGEQPPENPPLSLNEEQQKALEAILRAVGQGAHEVFLLHGVTGSGKTEVYLQAIQEVLRRGRTSIVLVPEISLTPQMIERFQGRLGLKAVAVLHSRMLESQRLKEWQRLRSGEARVAVGTRSAIFAPAGDLGLIVVDEEHEPSYKQEDAPRYHAREVAVERGRIASCPVVLGSATPSVEAYHAARQRRFHLLELSQRIEELPLPQVEVVDMRQEVRRGVRGRIFSRRLEEALAECLAQRQQAILFLNRRGFATFVQCRACGSVLRCKACQVAMNYHIATRQMICHTCGAKNPAPEICPQCRSEYVRFQGIGTQRVESELSRLFPAARIARMDSDATGERGSHARILREFSRHEIDLIVGTQMIAKGLDFPRVTLVGVISADTSLHLPDFRSAERTFNLLTQVAGRAGRGKEPGKVIVQTYTPHHEGIVDASRHDYRGFYNKEIAIRKELNLPPFVRLIQLTVRSLRQTQALEAACRLTQICRRRLPKKIEVVGPVPAMIPRVRRWYRWQVLLKAPSLEPLQGKLLRIVREQPIPSGCRVAIDVDPLS